MFSPGGRVETNDSEWRIETTNFKDFFALLVSIRPLRENTAYSTNKLLLKQTIMLLVFMQRFFSYG